MFPHPERFVFDLWRKAKKNKAKQNRITANKCTQSLQLLMADDDEIDRASNRVKNGRDVHLNRSKVDAPSTRFYILVVVVLLLSIRIPYCLRVLCSPLQPLPLSLSISHYAICWWANETKKWVRVFIVIIFEMSHDKIKFIVYRSCQRISDCATTSTSNDRRTKN